MARDDELRREQAYADWIQEQIDRLLVKADEMMNAADKATYRALSKRSDNRRKELTSNRDAPIVGRLDMEDEDTFYIGKLLVDSGDIDQPALINWRAPFAERFYQATLDNNLGVGRRRTIKMARRTVSGFSDDTLVAGFKVAEPELVVPDPPPVVEKSPTGEAEVEALDHSTLSVEPSTLHEHSAELGDEPAGGAVGGAAATGDAETLPPRVEDSSDERPTYSDGAIALGPITEPAEPEPDAVDQPADDVEVEAPVRAADLLLDELERRRSGAMGEIVATIQADQDRLIRSDPECPLVIQGGPGTGKTVVALHRAAWVLYHHRDDSEAPSVLVLGPNERFVEYIAGVLPSLGEHDVTQLSLAALCRSQLNRGERERTTPRRADPPEVARIKGHAVMADVVARAVWLHVKPRSLEVGHQRYILRVTDDEVRQDLERLWQHSVPYQRVRSELRASIVRRMADQLAHRARRDVGVVVDGEALEADVRRTMTEIKFLEECIPTVTARSAVQRLFTDAEHRSSCTDALSAEQQALLTTGTYANGTRYRWSSDDMPLLDAASSVILGSHSRYTHVVVDEAQDLSPMAWRAIARRTSEGALTIAGDLAQATTAWSPDSWDDVAAFAGISGSGVFAELRLGYRVPEQVMLFAGRLLPSAAPTTALPRSFRRTSDPQVVRATGGVGAAIARLLREQVADDRSVAVICAPDVKPRLQRELDDLGVEATLLDDDETKGLEFDHVMVVEPADIARDDGTLGLRRLYIALTRCTKQLTVVHSKPLPTALALGISEDDVRSNVREARLKNLSRKLGRRRAASTVHPRSYQKWSTDEEGDLARRVASGLSLDEIVDLHQRSPRSIGRRIKKLKLEAPQD